MQKIKAILFCFIFSLPFYGFSQSDSTILPYSAYLTNILQFHPEAKLANLRIDLAEAEWLNAKGFFDPTVSTDFTQKQFDNKLYYRQYGSEVRIPTRLGIDAVAGYENTNGIFLNPENNTDKYGLWNIGLETNLLQGLWVNERNTAIKQAKIFNQTALNQQQTIINDLLYSASIAYLEWQKNAAFQAIFNENLKLAETYLANTVNSFFLGEKTAMDTLEASILFLDAQNQVTTNQVALVKARQIIENYLWQNDFPVNLPQSTLPENETLFSPNIIQPIINENNIRQLPIIQEKTNKLASLEIEQKLKREKLKPKLKVKFNPLLATTDEGIEPVYSNSNYKLGVDFTTPVLMRTARAGIQKNEIKISELTLDISNKVNEISNKIENSIQQQKILSDLIVIQEASIEGYRTLLDAENEKFNFGESSVFLLNKRQEKYILGQLKLTELKNKLQLEVLTFLYLTNNLPKP